MLKPRLLVERRLFRLRVTQSSKCEREEREPCIIYIKCQSLYVHLDTVCVCYLTRLFHGIIRSRSSGLLHGRLVSENRLTNVSHERKQNERRGEKKERWVAGGGRGGGDRVS